MRYLLAVLLLAFLLLYVVPNIARHPWHTAAFVVAGCALVAAAGGSRRFLSWLNASPHPAARRIAAAHAFVTALVRGEPPYGAGRWWIARSLAQAVYWMVVLGAVLAVLVALGAAFTWLDRT